VTPDIQKVDEKIKKRSLEAHKKFIGGAADGAANEIRWRLLIFEMVTPILLCLYA
jgi:hypothetical protein